MNPSGSKTSHVLTVSEIAQHSSDHREAGPRRGLVAKALPHQILKNGPLARAAVHALQQLFQQAAESPCFDLLQRLAVAIKGRRAEVTEQAAAVSILQDVVRVEIAMHDPLGVQGPRRLRDAEGDPDDCGRGKPSAFQVDVAGAAFEVWR